MNYKETAKKLMDEFCHQFGHIQYEEGEIEAALEEDCVHLGKDFPEDQIAAFVNCVIEFNDNIEVASEWCKTFDTLGLCM